MAVVISVAIAIVMCGVYSRVIAFSSPDSAGFQVLVERSGDAEYRMAPCRFGAPAREMPVKPIRLKS